MKPNMSQLGALRTVMGELFAADTTRVTDWIAHLKTISTRADKWPEGTLEKIKQLMLRPQTVWTLIGLENGQDGGHFAGAPRPGTLPGINWLRNTDMQRFAVRALLLKSIRAHKRDSEKETAREAAA